jgi:Lrp/AsnC family transcriptional regulator, leucine-responsive regulatory protein
MKESAFKLARHEADILRTLQLEGRISNVDLAERVGLSESPCYRRVRALEDAGVIQGYSARVNQRSVGLQVTAFVLVTLEKPDDKKKTGFLAHVEAEDHVVECHAMSGSSDFLLKVVARSMDHFSALSMERILRFPGVKNIESNFSLKAIKEYSALPISSVF